MDCHVLATPHSERSVAIDYFDPEGVSQIRRTLSRLNSSRFESHDDTTHTNHHDSGPLEDAEAGRALEEPTPSIGSDATTVAADVDTGGFDFEQTLRDYIERRDEAGIEPRELGVLFDNLCVVGLGASARFQPTLGSMLNPLNILRKVQALRHPPLREIISGFEGLVRPGEMLLVLGRPGAGCTTLLKTLTNQTSSFQSVSGDIAFSSLDPELLRTRFRGDVQYIPEADIHFPTLTVKDTVRFAARCRAPAGKARVGPTDVDTNQTRHEFETMLTDMYMTIFGLRAVQDSVVGDEKLRGVSGGEKKRVSIAEAMAARALVASWDNSTRGLDSSTALAYIAALRLATTHLHRTSMVCLYQASDAMYDMFDKVCLLYEGRMVYFGPANEAKTYFTDMGWTARSRQSTPDFLVAVTDPGARVWRSDEPPDTSEDGEPKASDIKDNERVSSQSDPMNTSAPEEQVDAPNSESDDPLGPHAKVTETMRTPVAGVDDAKHPFGDHSRDVSGFSHHSRAASGALPPPRTPAEFAEHYMRSDVRRRVRQDMESFRKECLLEPVDGGGGSHSRSATAETAIDTEDIEPAETGPTLTAMGLGKHHPHTQAYKRSAKAEQARRARSGSAYVISIPMQIAAVMARRMRIVKGGWFTQVLTSVVFIVQAVIISTTFLKIPNDTGAYFSRGGVMFFALFLPALYTMSEIPSLFAQRPIIQRHERAAMYHPLIEALALTLVDIPVTAVTISFYVIILYFVIDLQRTAGQFFIFFLFVLTTALSMKSLFRALAAAFPQEAPAQAVAGIVLLALGLYTGYQIPIPSMIGALRWISYINPIRYSFEAVMVNEFHTLNGRCSTLVPSGVGYENVALANQVCTTVGSMPGQDNVDGNRFLDLSFGYRYSHLWRNFGILIAFAMFFTTALLVFTEIQTTTARNENDVVLFRRGSKAEVIKDAQTAVGDDEEKPATMSATSAGGPDASKPTETFDDGRTLKESDDVDREAKQHSEERRAIAAEGPKMTDVFSWQKISYTIPVGKGETRVLLKEVSGYVEPGKLTALMGASGAGKTTLLNVLAERVDTGVVSGDRFVNGQRLPRDFQAQTGYCQQMDTHVPTQTVREALRFSARLRQPREVPEKEKDEYAEKCLKMCGLEAFADAMVGSLGVEHRKRTTIGVELAAKPQLLLFLDEPTSGLDSQSAWAIVEFLRELADNGQAILCTIHQPSAELFQVFDRILLLRKGGETVYFGDLGPNSATLINHFEANGARQCKPDENPAEYMLEVIGAGATAPNTRDWHDVWLKSGGSQRLTESLDGIHSDGRRNPPVEATLTSTFATSWAYQLRELTARQFVSYWRNPSYVLSKLILNIFGGIFIGFTFFKANNTIQGTQNKVFAIFISTILSSPLAGQMHVPFINTRDIYEVRERSSRMYSWSSLITAQILVELPWNILGSILFFFCWFWTVGFETDRAGYTFLMLALLFPMYYTTVALAVASMAPSAEIAGLLFNFLFSFVLTFNGVVQPFSQLGWWRWMYRLSPYTYLIEGLLGQVIGEQLISCAEKEFVTVEPPSGTSCETYLSNYISNKGGYLNNPGATSACQFCPSRTTDQFLGPAFNIHYSHHWRDLGIFCAFIVFNTVAVYVMTYLFRVQSGSPMSFLKRRFGRK
ncbi:hypothetical protein HGRIS_001666 [Hohenbuehelia grisea]|uniref:ABC transporter domain-containing protein n=1 Tax=Hohenbuehelia grisea TaxID=104357 RepID=A0ABR3JJU4_9AGAR